MKRSAFFISDSTGLTAQALGESLLGQFESVEFDKKIIPFVDSEEKANAAVAEINAAARRTGHRPIVFDTVVDKKLCQIIASADCFVVDVLASFLDPLSKELNIAPTETVGPAKTPERQQRNWHRADAMHFAIENDDGARFRDYDQAEIILIGVSRSGKTPSSVYLALHNGIFVANYPLTPDDLETSDLPKVLVPHRERLYGLTIDPERLSAIRSERKPGSRYSSPRQCEDEVRQAEAMFARYGIPSVDSTHRSIEEIAAHVMANPLIKN